jgi:adenine-specific DNA methylase
VSAAPYPKRLIEVDLPIKTISAHARREKSIRHGHISTLHIWWARRPLAACRAVLCASLWPDPADAHCPQAFRDVAAAALCDFAEKVRNDKRLAELSAPHWTRWRSTDTSRLRATDPTTWGDLRCALFDFIGDFSNWDASAAPAFLETARRITGALDHGSRPLVFDPFAGGGSIPLEALRVGADVFASDLNPIPVIINRVLLEYMPRHGSRLVEELKRWGHWLSERARAELGCFYPLDKAGAVPVAFLWARTIRCEGPRCGVALPLSRSFIIGKRSKQYVGLLLRGAAEPGKALEFEIGSSKAADTFAPATTAQGAAMCPRCGFTTPKPRLRAQLAADRGGANNATLLWVAENVKGRRHYRLPNTADLDAVRSAKEAYRRIELTLPEELIPQDPVWKNNPIRVHLYGMTRWIDLFSARQAVAIATLTDLVAGLEDEIIRAGGERDIARAVTTCLGLTVSKVADFSSTLARWIPVGEKIGNTFGRQALPMVWDFAEANPLADISGSIERCTGYLVEVAEAVSAGVASFGTVERASATKQVLANDSAALLFTDPPYYDAVPYADLSDFFYIWLRRALAKVQPDLFQSSLTPKVGECILKPVPTKDGSPVKDSAYFESTMTEALREARRVIRPTDALGVVVFAHKSTAGWEAQLNALVEAGWAITASWPIDTERPGRLRAMKSAALASSVHLVCRPRERADGTLRHDVGSWRDVLQELPDRIHEWMPRLAQEGVVGADAIFACLGPALEIFSRYARVERASGDVVLLREYLEQVWAAVAREALSMLFDGADASGLEADARLTAMWLWTLGSGTNGSGDAGISADNSSDNEEIGDDEDEDDRKTKVSTGFVLEFDTARKIAQGLGAHLEKLTDVVEVKKDKARLLAVAERAKALFAKSTSSADQVTATGKAKKKQSKKQLGLFAEIEAADMKGMLSETGVPMIGETTLDRVHQAMILFAANRSDALKRFVVEEGVGKDVRFWRLAQSFSALYPAGSDEKRWIDGVLARKKSLGF